MASGMNRFAKVVDGKVQAVVWSELEHDDRRNEAGELIWRRVMTHIPPYDVATEMLGASFLEVCQEVVLETYEILPLADMPSLHDRIEALENGDIALIEKHRRIVQSLKEAGKYP